VFICGRHLSILLLRGLGVIRFYLRMERGNRREERGDRREERENRKEERGKRKEECGKREDYIKKEEGGNGRRKEIFIR